MAGEERPGEARCQVYGYLKTKDISRRRLRSTWQTSSSRTSRIPRNSFSMRLPPYIVEAIKCDWHRRECVHTHCQWTGANCEAYYGHP